MFNGKKWRERAIAAETALAELHTKPVLIRIDRKGRINEFVFEKDGEIVTIKTFATWDDDFYKLTGE